MKKSIKQQKRRQKRNKTRTKRGGMFRWLAPYETPIQKILRKPGYGENAFTDEEKMILYEQTNMYDLINYYENINDWTGNAETELPGMLSNNISYESARCYENEINFADNLILTKMEEINNIKENLFRDIINDALTHRVSCYVIQELINKFTSNYKYRVLIYASNIVATRYNEYDNQVYELLQNSGKFRFSL